MKKETKKLIAAGIVMALSCGAWGSVSAAELTPDSLNANGKKESIGTTADNVTFNKKIFILYLQKMRRGKLLMRHIVRFLQKMV